MVLIVGNKISRQSNLPPFHLDGARLQCIHCVRPCYAHVSCEGEDVTSAGSSGHAFGQAGTSDSRYSERHLIYVHCSQSVGKSLCIKWHRVGYETRQSTQGHTHAHNTPTHTHTTNPRKHTHKTHTHIAWSYHTEHTVKMQSD